MGGVRRLRFRRVRTVALGIRFAISGAGARIDPNQPQRVSAMPDDADALPTPVTMAEAGHQRRSVGAGQGKGIEL